MAAVVSPTKPNMRSSAFWIAREKAWLTPDDVERFHAVNLGSHSQVVGREVRDALDYFVARPQAARKYERLPKDVLNLMKALENSWKYYEARNKPDRGKHARVVHAKAKRLFARLDGVRR